MDKMTKTHTQDRGKIGEIYSIFIYVSKPASILNISVDKVFLT